MYGAPLWVKVNGAANRDLVGHVGSQWGAHSRTTYWSPARETKPRWTACENSEFLNYVGGITMQVEDTQEETAEALHCDLEAVKAILCRKNVQLDDDQEQRYGPTNATWQAWHHMFPECPRSVESRAKDVGVCRRCGGAQRTGGQTHRRAQADVHVKIGWRCDPDAHDTLGQP